jgi:hypothetical protein
VYNRRSPYATEIGAEECVGGYFFVRIGRNGSRSGGAMLQVQPFGVF